LALGALILTALACPDPAKKALSAFHKEMDTLTLTKDRCEALATLGGECTASSFRGEGRFLAILIHPSRLTLTYVGPSILIDGMDYEPASQIQISLDDGSFPTGDLRGPLVTELVDTLSEWASVSRQMEAIAEEEFLIDGLYVVADDSIPLETIRQTVFSAGQVGWSGIWLFRANGELRAREYRLPEIDPSLDIISDLLAIKPFASDAPLEQVARSSNLVVGVRDAADGESHWVFRPESCVSESDECHVQACVLCGEACSQPCNKLESNPLQYECPGGETFDVMMVCPEWSDGHQNPDPDQAPSPLLEALQLLESSP
jgi:hypothetical protein